MFSAEGSRRFVAALALLVGVAWSGAVAAAPGSLASLAMAFKPAAAKSVGKKAPRKAAGKPAKRKQAQAASRSKPPVSARAAGRQKAVARRASARPLLPIPVDARPSYGQAFGLHETPDPLALKSSVALVLDQETGEVLLSKNSEAVLPVASLTKLMTALVVVEARQPLNEMLVISEEDIDTAKGSHSRLAVGTRLTREEMLHLALMSSENRAANALGRHYPGGLTAFVQSMNRKAAQIGMHSTRYVEPTGLSSMNQSSAQDLALLAKEAYRQPLIRELSTSPEYQVVVGNRQVQFRNTNGLVRNPTWEIGLQKTGYISEAGRCLVMQARLAGRKLILVFLDSAGRYSRLGDAERVRRWVESATDAAPVLPSLPSLRLDSSAEDEAVVG